MGYKVISAVNFKSGGKSSVLRLLAEALGETIFNFDKNRDAVFYNAVNTVNIPEPEKCNVLRTKQGLNICGKQLYDIDYYLCDFGGYHDSRIAQIKSDLYIIPTFDDFETIRESLRMERYIREKVATDKKPKILFILNNNSRSKKEKVEEVMEYIKKTLQKKGSNADVMYMPYSELIKELVNKKCTVKEVLDSFFLAKYSYRNILEFQEELKEYVLNLED